MRVYVLGGRDQEPGRAADRVADLVLGPRRGHRDHELDDVARGAELTVDAGAGDLREQVLVQVAVRVPVLHRDVIEQVDHSGEQRGVLDGVPRILHVLGIGRAFTPEAAQERVHLRADDPVHRLGVLVLEPVPAQVRRLVPEDRVLDSGLRDPGPPSFRVCSSSRRRMKSRFVICSITSSGFESPRSRTRPRPGRSRP